MNNKKKKGSINPVLLLYFLIGFFLIGAVLFSLKLLFAESMPLFFDMLERNGFNYLATLSIQVSVSFIVISVVTVFSQNNCIIYWQDVMSYKLVDPKFTNFNALSSYVFANLLLSLLLVMFNCKYVYICFFITVLLIMVLSVKMMEVYFSRDKIKEQMAKQYQKEKANRKTSQHYLDQYRDHKRKVIQYTMQAIDSNDIDVVCENLSLLYQNDEKEDALYIVKKLALEEKIYTISRIAKTSCFIFLNEDYITSYYELCKEILLLSKNEENNRYILSIFKSMCEAYLGNNEEEKKTLRSYIESFAEYCSTSNQKEFGKKLIQECYKNLNYEVLA